MKFDFLTFDLSPEFLEIHKILTEDQFTVSHTGVSTRMINYYEKEGYLFDSDRKPGMKRKFNTIDVVWINIIKHLFDFGFTKDNILFIKKWIIDNVTLQLTKEAPVGYNVLEFYLSYIIAYKTDIRIFVSRHENKKIFTLRLMSLSHGVDFNPPSIYEFPHFIIPLAPILNSFWQYYTGKKIEIADRSLISIKGKDKPLVNKVIQNDFISLNIENKKDASGKYVSMTQHIPKDQLSKVCQFLTKQKHSQIVLNYGAEIGKPISGTIKNSL